MAKHPVTMRMLFLIAIHLAITSAHPSMSPRGPPHLGPPPMGLAPGPHMYRSRGFAGGYFSGGGSVYASYGPYSYRRGYPGHGRFGGLRYGFRDGRDNNDRFGDNRNYGDLLGYGSGGGYRRYGERRDLDYNNFNNDNNNGYDGRRYYGIGRGMSGGFGPDASGYSPYSTYRIMDGYGGGGRGGDAYSSLGQRYGRYGPRLFAGYRDLNDNGYGRNFDNGFDRNFDNGYGRNFDNSYGRNFENGNGRNINNGYDRNFDNGYGRNFDNGYGSNVGNGNGRNFDNGYGRNFDNGIGRNYDNSRRGFDENNGGRYRSRGGNSNGYDSRIGRGSARALGGNGYDLNNNRDNNHNGNRYDNRNNGRNYNNNNGGNWDNSLDHFYANGGFDGRVRGGARRSGSGSGSRGSGYRDGARRSGSGSGSRGSGSRDGVRRSGSGSGSRSSGPRDGSLYNDAGSGSQYSGSVSASGGRYNNNGNNNGNGGLYEVNYDRYVYRRNSEEDKTKISRKVISFGTDMKTGGSGVSAPVSGAAAIDVGLGAPINDVNYNNGAAVDLGGNNGQGATGISGNSLKGAARIRKQGVGNDPYASSAGGVSSEGMYVDPPVAGGSSSVMATADVGTSMASASLTV